MVEDGSPRRRPSLLLGLASLGAAVANLARHGWAYLFWGAAAAAAASPLSFFLGRRMGASTSHSHTVTDCLSSGADLFFDGAKRRRRRDGAGTRERKKGDRLGHGERMLRKAKGPRALCMTAIQNEAEANVFILPTDLDTTFRLGNIRIP